MNNFDYNNITPFKWFVLENFPFIENDFEAINNYRLFSKVVEYLNKVIDDMNAVGQQTENITNAMTELQDYVNNYFDSLDIQEEVNNKLDKMVEDGTLLNLISPILNELTENVNNALNTINNSEMKSIREKYYNNYKIYETPLLNDDFFKNVIVYRSNEKMNIDYFVNSSNFRVSGGNDIYISPNGNDTSGDGTQNNPYKTVQKGITATTSGGTLHLMEGVYQRINTSINKNMNLIGEGIVILTDSDDQVTWTQNVSYPNVYQITRSNISNKIIDIRNKNRGVYPLLNQVNSIEECNYNLNTYYYSDNILYVNIGEEVTIEKILVPYQREVPILHANPSNNATDNVKVYMKNLTFIGGHKGCFTVYSQGNYTAYLYAEDCNLLYGGGLNNEYRDNGFTNQGAFSLLLNCKCNYSTKDGFNYTNKGSFVARGIEINCEASNNGLLMDDNTNNGSTAHMGSKILRINGNYFNNKGSNVADVQQNTVSYNFNCKAFDCEADGEVILNSDFSCQQAGTTMYLINCFAKGNSYNNLQCTSGSTMYLDNVSYDRQTGSGYIVI